MAVPFCLHTLSNTILSVYHFVGIPFCPHHSVRYHFHSFVTLMYVAPLQGYYSEALPTHSTAKRSSFKARTECVRVNPGEAIAVQKEAHSKQRGQPPRMH